VHCPTRLEGASDLSDTRRDRLPYAVPHLPDASVVILPESVQNDVGIYGNAASTLVKELRAASITSEYLHDADHRQWMIHMGDVPTELIVGIATGVIGNGIWALFKRFLGDKFGSHPVNLHIVRQRRSANGELSTTIVDMSGTGVKLAELLETALNEKGADAVGE